MYCAPWPVTQSCLNECHSVHLSVVMTGHTTKSLLLKQVVEVHKNVHLQDVTQLPNVTFQVRGQWCAMLHVCAVIVRQK